MKKLLILLFIGVSCLFNLARADDSKIISALEAIGFKVVEIQDSPISELRTVITTKGIFYASVDGSYLLQAPLYDISGGKPRNITNVLLSKDLEKLADQMIIYKAPKEQYLITVFTDITCGYCTKLHKNMAEYNNKGITVRYLAFPRQGPNSENATQMRSIWCNADRKAAFDKAMNGETPAELKCDIDIGRHYELGHMFGVTGTPAMVFGDTLVPGYLEPNDLLDTLKQIKALQK